MEVVEALLKEHAVAVFQDFPQGLQIGIDMTTFVSNDLLRGFKFIPPGIHQIYWSPRKPSKETGLVGFWHEFKIGEVTLRRWDKAQGLLLDDSADQTKINSLRNSLADIAHFLVPLNDPSSSLDIPNWTRLTSYLTLRFLQDVIPKSKFVSSTTNYITGKENIDTEDVINFTKINLTRSWEEGVSGNERTKWARDKSWELRRVIKTFERQEDILAEFQLAFVLFMALENYSGFEQWKTIMHLFCLSTSITKEFSGLFIMFKDVLLAQLELMPADFACDILSENNFVTKLLLAHINGLEEMDLEGYQDLKLVPSEIRSFMYSKFGCEMNADVENEEDRPIIVELDKNCD